ncbi:MAG TPA: large conductance mechanosensitive channel protein MscL [Actinomycetota bacterium]|jgi:large conductance mechanosensitive channel|nr:large conductance mechanosensitive channel protein MscL [Actinomycetota bacterium]
MLGEFKTFVVRGNLLELAVAFIMGVAFATVVTAFTNITLSFIAAIFGGSVSFNHLTFKVNDTPIPYGAFLTAVVSFLIIAWVLFFLVQAYNRVNQPREESKNTKPCDYCQTEIPINAVRCPNCTSQLVTAGS